MTLGHLKLTQEVQDELQEEIERLNHEVTILQKQIEEFSKTETMTVTTDW